jgi:hypothetical protein
VLKEPTQELKVTQDLQVQMVLRVHRGLTSELKVTQDLQVQRELKVHRVLTQVLRVL